MYIPPPPFYLKGHYPPLFRLYPYLLLAITRPPEDPMMLFRPLPRKPSFRISKPNPRNSFCLSDLELVVTTGYPCSITHLIRTCEGVLPSFSAILLTVLVTGPDSNFRIGARGEYAARVISFPLQNWTKAGSVQYGWNSIWLMTGLMVA